MGRWSTRDRNLWVPMLAMAAALTTACIEAESRVCAWGGICPPGMQCHADTESCVVPAQLTDCVGINDGEGCPAGGLAGHFVCRNEVCLPSVCGDGLVDSRLVAGQALEACDDGNTDAGDGCRADCRGTETCGDTWLDTDAGEECDLGPSGGDGCTHECRFPRCGDNIRSGGEACDDGEANSDSQPGACRTNCRLPGCGDHVLDPDERGGCWSLSGDGRRGTGPGTADLAVGDLDGDSLPDLVVVNGDASSLSVFLSDGQGGLQEAPGSPQGLDHPVTAATLADLDGDGALDVVVVGSQGDVAWLPGDGQGGLSAPRNTALAASFTDVTVADLGDNGDLEILATDTATDTLRVLRLNTTLTIEAVASYDLGPSGAEPVALAAADLDGDGRPEVAVANRSYAQLALFTPDGAGALQPVAGFPLSVGEQWSSTVGDILLGDANGDGHLDLVWLDVRSWSSSWVGTLLGDGNLGFTATPSGLLELGPGPLHLAGGDIDGDGRLDLVAPRTTDTAAYLMLGDAASTFALDPEGPVTLQASSRVVMLADFDGDGLSDLVLADQYAGHVDLYLKAP